MHLYEITPEKGVSPYYVVADNMEEARDLLERRTNIATEPWRITRLCGAIGLVLGREDEK